MFSLYFDTRIEMQCIEEINSDYWYVDKENRKIRNGEV